MSPRAVRSVVLAVCVLGIGGMVAGSVADNNGAALTAGLVTAAASLCLMVAYAVSSPPRGAAEADVDARAAEVEQQVGRIVASGVAEEEVRALVRSAVALGEARSR